MGLNTWRNVSLSVSMNHYPFYLASPIFYFFLPLPCHESEMLSFSNEIGGELEIMINKNMMKKNHFYENFSKNISPWLGMHVPNTAKVVNRLAKSSTPLSNGVDRTNTKISVLVSSLNFGTVLRNLDVQEGKST